MTRPNAFDPNHCSLPNQSQSPSKSQFLSSKQCILLLSFAQYGTAAAVLLAAMLMSSNSMQAQLGDLFKHDSVADAGSLGKLGSASPGQSLNSGSASSAAGVYQLCIKNNYLTSNTVASVKDSFMRKLGGSTKIEPGYTDAGLGTVKGTDGKSWICVAAN